MYFIENANGQIVRAIDWSGDKIFLVQIHDTDRIEAAEDLSYFERLKIKYTLLNIFEKKDFEKISSYKIGPTSGHLKLVHQADEVLPSVDPQSDDIENFKATLKKTTLACLLLALLTFVGSLFVKPTEVIKPELEVVQVMDRKQIERMVVVAPRVEPKPNIVVPVKVKKSTLRKPKVVKMAKKNTPTGPTGVLGVLGSLKSSQQKGGLNLNQANASAGIGRGGTQGSGGVQTAVYSKGLFASPLGTGGKVSGAGGYGTKGKGGGRAGYGQIALVGSSDSFFDPIENEAWNEGGLDRNEIAAVIQRHLSEVRFCYEKGLQQKPNLTGRMSMKFMIGPHGGVTTAHVTNSSLHQPPVENCIRDRLKGWKFPKPQGGVTVKVDYPFVLRRVSDT